MKGDIPVSKSPGQVLGKGVRERTPAYVLLYHGQQIGALQALSLHSIFHIEIFPSYQNKKHGTKFVELIERAARDSGLSQIEICNVTNPVLEHILEKRGWNLEEREDGEKNYVKILGMFIQ